MGAGLVGSVGAVSQGASAAAVTPAWGTGESRTAGNTLVLWVATDGSGTLPAAPSGWTALVQVANGANGTSSIFWATAAGGDAAPTVAGIASTVISAGLAEFSGVAASPTDQTGSTTGAVSPISVAASAVDSAAGDLVLVCVSGTTSTNIAIVYSDSLNNGATANSTNNSAAGKHHYDFTWGVTTGNSVADSDSVSWTGALGHGMYAIGSLKAASGSTWNITAPVVSVSTISAVLAASAAISAPASSISSVSAAMTASAAMSATIISPSVVSAIVSTQNFANMTAPVSSVSLIGVKLALTAAMSAPAASPSSVSATLALAATMQAATSSPSIVTAPTGQAAAMSGTVRSPSVVAAAIAIAAAMTAPSSSPSRSTASLALTAAMVAAAFSPSAISAALLFVKPAPQGSNEHGAVSFPTGSHGVSAPTGSRPSVMPAGARV